MHLVGYDYNNYDCFQVGLKKKKQLQEREKSIFPKGEKHFLPCLLDSFWQKAVSSCTTQFNQSLSPEKKKKNNIASQRFGLEYLLWFPMPPHFSSMFLSVFQALFEHFACHSTPLHVTLFSLWPATVFSLGQEMKHWFTSKAAIKFNSFIDQQEVHLPYWGQR